jgi:hypothetical protein
MKTTSICYSKNVCYRAVIITSFICLLLTQLPAQNLLLKPESVAFDSTENRYLISNYGDGAIVQIDSNGVQSHFKNGLGNCYGNHIVGNTLYVSVNEYAGVVGGKAVLGLDLATSNIVMSCPIPEASNLDGIAADASGYLYVIDTSGGKIYKIRISDQSYSLFVNAGLFWPQDCIFDEANNRLLIAFSTSNAPIKAVNLADSTVSLIVSTPLHILDGITQDQYGNVYVAAHMSGGLNGCVYKYDNTFSNPPELISPGHYGPAGLDYNKQDNILAVPNFYANSVDFLTITPNPVDGSNNNLPKNFHLYQNYPNPFNPSTTISYSLARPSTVDLVIYNVRGQSVRVLERNSRKSTGFHLITWDGTDDGNRQVSTKIYLYQLRTKSFSGIKKMNLIR